MDLSLSEEQQLLKDSAARFVKDHYSVEQKRALRDTEPGFSADNWQKFAELGWLALPFAEADDGIGGGALDVAVLMEEFGRGLVAEPFLVNVAICGAFLRRASESLRAAHIPKLMEGQSQWAFAYAEANSRYRLNNVATVATATDAGFQISGAKISVLNAHAANHFIVSARTAGEQRDEQGISLFVVPSDAKGLTLKSYQLVDGSYGADVSFDNVPVDAADLIGELGQGQEMMDDVVAEAIIAIGAEAVGAMDALLEQTVEYTKTREQFGQPIGSFQALQHRMADMFMLCQATRSILYYAAIAREEQRDDMQQAASALKVKLDEAGRFVSQQAVQLHGGIGMTDELGIGHYYKRLLLLNTLFGDGEHHLDQYLKG
jgi:alkylation response protein AidB-like acyl-CoA dehydrogenase